MSDKNATCEEPDAAGVRYEPPTIETVLTADDLSREIHYAGLGGSPNPTG